MLKNNTISHKAFNDEAQNNDFFEGSDYGKFIDKYMFEVLMCTEVRKIRDNGSPSRSPTRNSHIARQIKHQQQTGQPITTTDFTPLIELYVTLFCKHLYYNPKIERDIQIFLSQDSRAPPEKSKQMFAKNESQASISK